MPVPMLCLDLVGARRLVRLSSDTEFFALYEVFATSDYVVETDAPVHRIIDIGANVGAAAFLFAERYPEAQIIALEPAPDTFQKLVANVRDIERIRPMNLAAGIDGAVQFDVTLPSAERRIGASGVEVQSISLSTLLSRLGWESVDLLKVDAEGAEFTVFADPRISCVASIVAEVHQEFSPHGKSDPADWLVGFDVRLDGEEVGGAAMLRANRRSAESNSDLSLPRTSLSLPADT